MIYLWCISILYTFTKDISTGRTETFKDAIQNVDKLKKVIFDLFNFMRFSSDILNVPNLFCFTKIIFGIGKYFFRIKLYECWLLFFPLNCCLVLNLIVFRFNLKCFHLYYLGSFKAGSRCRHCSLFVGYQLYRILSDVPGYLGAGGNHHAGQLSHQYKQGRERVYFSVLWTFPII